MYTSDDSDDYAGWSGQGGGAGIGFSAMWQGYVGIDIQMLYTTHELSGSFDDPLSGQLDFNYNLAQFDFNHVQSRLSKSLCHPKHRRGSGIA